MANFLKLVLRVLKTVLKNQKNLIFKNRLKYLKRKCFSALKPKTIMFTSSKKWL